MINPIKWKLIKQENALENKIIKVGQFSQEGIKLRMKKIKIMEEINKLSDFT